MGTLFEAAGQLAGQATRKLSGVFYDWMAAVSDAIETAQAQIASLLPLLTAKDRVVQSVYRELVADTTFTTGQAILTAPITTTTVNGTLDIHWTASCAGNTASTFYKIHLLLDGVTVQACRFTLDAASATFAFPLCGVKRITGVAPGVHSVVMQAQCAAASMTFSISGPNDNGALLVEELLP